MQSATLVILPSQNPRLVISQKAAFHPRRSSAIFLHYKKCTPLPLPGCALNCFSLPSLHLNLGPLCGELQRAQRHDQNIHTAVLGGHRPALVIVYRSVLVAHSLVLVVLPIRTANKSIKTALSMGSMYHQINLQNSSMSYTECSLHHQDRSMR